jgi:hypothetical protein
MWEFALFKDKKIEKIRADASWDPLYVEELE